MPSSPPIQRDFSLRHLNSFGIDAKADAYLQIFAVDGLKHLADSTLKDVPRLALGGGSNILLTGDFHGLVLHMCNRGIEVLGEQDDAIHVRAAAGENWHQFVQWTLAHNMPGLENLSLIPGSVGAAPIQNIGAYGVELREFMHELRAFDFDTSEVITLNNAACQFAYRDSIFKHGLLGRAVILDVTFALPKKWQPNVSYADLANELNSLNCTTSPSPHQISEAVIAVRTRKLPDPAVIGNAGSFFKNPLVSAAQRDALAAVSPNLVSYLQPDGRYKLAAGWLIDQCGWKGRSVGAAGVYEKQALVLVNRGGATGEEIAKLAGLIQNDVRARFDVMLEPEPVFI
ncbi:UDP-N-acetylmuramate dehydrogenase [soil metagenome]